MFGTVSDSDVVDEDVIDNFENTSVYGTTSDTVIAGRAAIGYLWNIFDGEPTKFANAIYTVNATLGLEFGYRLFDNADASNTITEIDNINVPPVVPLPAPPQPFPYEVFETATVETKNEAFDILAVLRLPFTEDNKFALLLKGGVAYNMYSFETTQLSIEANLEVPQEDYNRVIELSQKQDHNEFLPALGAGLEYMFYANFGISAEYNAIFGSSHNAD
ncbi:MAG TPA: hypothetical protein VI522_06810, partial [Gammaproteobacteria bacterium]|nr:hypothetical protein [Gammaproteobacteria bacterium]